MATGSNLTKLVRVGPYDSLETHIKYKPNDKDYL